MSKTREITVYCTHRCRDGKGGHYEVGDKEIFEGRTATEDAAPLLASNRFTTDPNKVRKPAKKQAKELAKKED